MTATTAAPPSATGANPTTAAATSASGSCASPSVPLLKSASGRTARGSRGVPPPSSPTPSGGGSRRRSTLPPADVHLPRALHGHRQRVLVQVDQRPQRAEEHAPEPVRHRPGLLVRVA